MAAKPKRFPAFPAGNRFCAVTGASSGAKDAGLVCIPAVRIPEIPAGMAAWLNGICAEAMAKPAVIESVAKLDPRVSGKRLLAGRRNVSQITQVLWKSLFLT
ncbi:hypothetical protein A1356_09320 [Methylomonas koyamae]|uniref:Uncharacterized protein n=1 Tax=Methylomonas koyamae TaxID=702114 RepID=A0AA91DDL0_9GAMM|nr:hypothetical protein A1356_09320 [Methylomonas koyamae]